MKLWFLTLKIDKNILTYVIVYIILIIDNM